MSTAVSKNTEDLAEESGSKVASKQVLKSAYESVMAAIEKNRNIILISGETSKGKTALLHTVCKDSSANCRIISLAGKDIPEGENQSNAELNSMLDFMLESTDLRDKLIITLDDAQRFPVNFLSKLIKRGKKLASENQQLQILLTGPVNFKSQLLAIDTIDEQDLTHCPMDSLLCEEEILSIAKTKDYKISSNIRNLRFSPEALQALSEFVDSDKEKLDVVLEWCAAIAKKDQVVSIKQETTTLACEYMQQFSRDKNLRLVNSYPPTHEVYRYINSLQASNSKVDKPVEKVKKKETKKRTAKSQSNAINNNTKIPAVDLKADRSKVEAIEPEYSPAKKKNIPIVLSREIPEQKENSTKNSIPALATFLGVLVLSFIVFIAYRIGSDPKVDNQTDANIVLNKSNSEQELVTAQQKKSQSLDTSKNEVSQKSVIHDGNNQKIIASDTSDASNTKIYKPFVAPLILGELALDGNDKKAEIQKLLVQANYQFDNKQLTTPAGDNALETYQQILKISPDHVAALAGVKSVHDKYINWGTYYLNQNDLGRAKRFFNKALEIEPENTISITNLKNIENLKNQGVSQTESIVLEQGGSTSALSNEVIELLASAKKNMIQIENDISANERNYKLYQQTQETYQTILRSSPGNQQALQGLAKLSNYYSTWAELQFENRNYNIALFLYSQAFNLDPNNVNLSQRIDQIREIKKSL